ncbi:MAG: substrate-binding domain-containing protein [Lentisphaeria bacterium]
MAVAETNKLARASKDGLWVTIAGELRSRISGLAPGTRLPTVRDLMKEFAVSQATVQQAMEAIEADGLISSRVGRGTFVADPAATQQRQKTIMVLRGDYPSRRGDDITRALQEAIGKAGHQGLVITYQDMEHAMDVLAPLKPSDGYMLQPLGAVNIPVALLHFLRSRSPAVVVSEAELDTLDVAGVYMDLLAQLSLGLRHLRDLGHRRIAFATGEPLVGDQRRLAALHRQTAEWLGVADGDDLVLTCDTRPGEDALGHMRERLAGLLAERGGKPPFTAMICGSYASALGVQEAFRQQGVAVPREVSVVVADNPDIEEARRAGLTLVGVSSTERAGIMLQCLTRRWENPASPYGTTFMTPTLVAGSSSGPAPVAG